MNATVYVPLKWLMIFALILVFPNLLKMPSVKKHNLFRWVNREKQKMSNLSDLRIFKTCTMHREVLFVTIWRWLFRVGFDNYSNVRNCTSWFVRKAVAFSFSAVSDCPLVFVCLPVCPYFCMTQYWIADLLYELLFVFRLFGKFIEGISDKLYWSCCQIAVVWTSSSSEHEKGERNCQRYGIGKSDCTMV